MKHAPPSTLAGWLRLRAAEQPDREAYLFLADGPEGSSVESDRLTWGELDARASAIAAALRETVEPGGRALLLYPPGLDFVAAFFGCLYAGVVAVPAYPPRLNDRSQSRLRSIALDASPGAALTTASIAVGTAAAAGILAERVPELAGCRWIATDELTASGSLSDLLEPDPSSIAFLQYTSGSTAAPKGVMVTHANLVHNERMIGQAFGLDATAADSVVVGWLPVYHDMGLIGNVLQPLVAGARCVLMSPVSFLQRPRRWLEAIERYGGTGGTVSGGPNFAYELCLRKVSPEGLDLSSWRVAFNGAEPVRASTLERFAERFAASGFRREAFYPCYGLAEATLFVSGGDPGCGPRIEEPRVGSGHVWLDQRIAIVDPDTSEEKPAGTEGEIWVAGPSVAAGYWGNPEATERDFHARLADGLTDGGMPFLRTGDLGFLDRGELFVTGRIKDLVILRGRNHYPQDLELTAERGHPDVHPGGGAAFAVEIDGEERLVLVHEVEKRRDQDLDGIAEAVRRAVAQEHEVQPYDVVLVRAGTVPKTSSGKVQRHAARTRYLAGKLAVLGRSRLVAESSGADSREAGPRLTRVELEALEPAERSAALVAFLRERAAEALGISADAVEPDRPLTGMGLDSLSAVELKGGVEAALGVTVPLAGLLEGENLRALAARLLTDLETDRSEPLPIASTHLEGDQPLSVGQRALWFLERLAPEAGAYNIAVAVRAQDLDVKAFRRALALLVDRHPALRTVFPWKGDEPVQRVLPVLEPDFTDVTDLGAEAWRPFDLIQGPLVRVGLFTGTAGPSVLLLVVHHLVADFWSLALMARELGALYRGETDLPALPLSYGDFTRWQNDRVAGPAGETGWSFWREALDGVSDLALTPDRPRPPVQTWAGLARGAELPADLMDRLRGLGPTLFPTLLAAFQAQLGRYASQDDFAVGAPTSGRGAPEWAGVVGYFVNPVAMRADLSGDPSFRTLLDRTRRTALAGLEHADYPVVLLAERLRPMRDPARPPLFQAMLALQQRRPGDDPGLPAFALGEEGVRISLGGLELESVALPERRAQFEISLNAAELPGGGLGLSLELNADLFDATTAARMLGHFRILLEAAVADPDRRLSDLPLLTPAEQVELIRDWDETARPSGPTPDLGLHELVAEQARRRPDATALIVDDQHLTYAKLMARAAELAERLRAMGVGPETPVALFVERSADLVIGALGILEASGVYLPLEPDHSAARLAYILEDAKAAVVVTQERVMERLPETNAAVLLMGPHPRPGGEGTHGDVLPVNAAYLIYTSGSTGRPKGVAVSHAAAVEHCLTWARAYGMTESDRVLQFPSAGFDASVEQIFSALISGATLVLRGAELWGPKELTEKLVEHGVTIADVPTAFFGRWVQDAESLPPTLRLIGIGGEELRTETARRWSHSPLVGAALLNSYGPTEAVISATLHPVQADEMEAGPVPIGRALAGRVARVLDRHGNPQPAGVPGELCLGGVLARGYLGRPDLTAERFVPDPFESPGGAGARLYRTGDLVRQSNGIVTFLGRIDDQVKIRGFRVEPGEIEMVLATHPEIREAAVLAMFAMGEGDGEGATKRLVAFVAPALPEDLRVFLRERLPDFMIPAGWVVLPDLPLNASGKVDRGALARLAANAEALESAGDGAPRTPDEELLAGIWAELLGRERVGIHDDFFALGGHSLLATRLIARASRVFGVDLPVSAVFQAPTVAGLAERIAGASSAPPIQPRPRVSGKPLPLSFAQRRLWFLEQLEPGTSAYNIPGEVRIAGPLDVERLASALAEIAQRHEVLRTVYAVEEGEPVQRELAPIAELSVVDLTETPEAPDIADRWAADEARRPFDLARGPVWRAVLLKVDADEHRLLVTFHHIASDGWSLDLFLDELSSLYAGRPVPELPVQYPDFAAWQQEWMQGEVLEKQLGYWTGRLAGLPVVELPADHARSAVRDSRGGVRSIDLPAETVAAVARLARREGVTVFMAVLATFQALLARHTGEAAIPVGTPVANRRRPEVERLIGLFVNTLVLDARTGDDPGLSTLMARVREACLGAYAHQDVPFERLVEELRPGRDLARNPFFQTMLVLEEPLPARTAGALTFEPVRTETGTAKLDLLAAVSPRPDGGWDVLAEHAVALFEPATIDRLLGHWRTLLNGAASADPSTRLSDLPLLSPPELRQIVAEWNDNETIHPKGLRLHDLVAAQAERTPDGIAVVGAVVGETERLSYRELMNRAGSLASRLRGMGVGPELRVGLCLNRTPDLIAAILGVLEAGAAYVPLDPAYPQDRLELMLTDSEAGLLLTESALADRFAFYEGRTLLLDVPSLPRRGKETRERGPGGEGDLAYVIYTSGSTGRPKGVGIEHRSAVALVHWSLEVFRPEHLQGVLAATSVCFDLSIWEIFVPLSMGGSIILAPNLVGLPELKALDEITLVNGVPSPMAELVGAKLPEGLRIVNLAGEALKPELVERIYAHPQVEQVINLYGPSEDTTYSTWTVVPSGVRGVRGVRGATRVTIGRPIAGTAARVLGPFGEPVPVGVHGELCLAGSGLARGYLGRPELTADRFVPDPFGAAGARMYRTGDRVKLLPDGQIDFLGRLDNQIKLHGIRIELGEIEATLASHPAVDQAAVALRSDGAEGARLVGYIVPAEGRDGEELPAELAAFLRGRLPQASVPTAWVVLSALPLSPNGKVDRKALPAPSRAGHTGASAPPRNPAEERVAAIFREVLGLESVGIHDDFFELGGHSLLAVRAAFRLGLPVPVLFQAPTVAGIAEHAERAERAEGVRTAAIPPAPGEGPWPVSFAQQRLWLIDRLEPGGSVYNMGLAIRLTGRLDVEALAESLGEVVRRHGPLRTVYPEQDGEPVQVVLPAVAGPAALTRLDLEPSELRVALNAEVARPFDLQAGPVARFLLVRLSESQHVLLATIHHIAADGWSLQLLFRDLAALYAGEPLPPLPLRYVDWAVWQRTALTTLAENALEAQLSFWRRELSGIPPLVMPTDRPRPPVAGRQGRSLRRPLPLPLVEALRQRSRKEGATLFAALLGGFMAMLARYSGQDDFAVGVPSAGRDRRETEDLIGFFVSTLALRAPLAGEPGFGELLRRVHRRMLAAQAHQDVPFERVVEELGGERDASRSPVFQAMLAFLGLGGGMGGAPTRMPGLEARLEDYDTSTAKFELTLSILDGVDGVTCTLEHRADLFDATTAIRLLESFRTLLAAAVVDPARPVSELPVLSEAQAWQLAAEWNDTAQALPVLCLHDLVSAQAAQTPDAVAVAGQDGRITYGELDRKARRVGARLRKLGIGPDVTVGLFAERTVEMIVGLLGILHAGGAWVPLDPDSPAERLGWMIEESRARVVVTPGGLRDRLPPLPAGVPAVNVEEPEEAVELEPGTVPGNLACVIFTSGSTGKPKGVALGHGNLVNRFLWAQEAYGLGPGDVVLQKAAFGFDVAAWEIFAALAAGARLVLARPGMHQDADYLVRTIAEQKVTVVHFVPSLLDLFLREEGLERCDSLRQVFSGGEALTPELRDRFHQHFSVPLDNGYGPTEISIDCTRWVCAPGDPGAEPWRVPIGRPIAGARIHLLGRLERGLPAVPLGAVGELCVAGPGVARGYHGRLDLTAERFVPDPFGHGGRVYRTGDLARALPDGNLELLGRADSQIKLRGVRIEPGEIEAALARHPAVSAVVVGVVEGRLVAWWTPRPNASESPGAGAAAELRDFLRRGLSEAMIPSFFVRLESFPRTPNGKVDRRALPAPEAARYQGEPGETGAEGSPVAQILAGLFAELLDLPSVPGVGPADNFFDLGGHSLLAARLVSRVRSVFEVELPLTALFEAPTPAGLAARLEAARRVVSLLPAPPPLVRRAEETAPLSYTQESLWFLHQLEPDDAYHVPGALRLRGSLREDVLERTLGEIVRRHEALRTVFRASGKEAIQRVRGVAAFELPVEDLSALPDGEREAEALLVLEREARRPFDLEAGPLVRARLVRLAPDDRLLTVVLHHIVSDAWSLGVLLRELGTIYTALSSGEPSPLPELPVQYPDYALWQRRWLTGEVLESEIAHWRRTLAGAPQSLDLPYDRPPSASTTNRGGRRSFALPAELTGRLSELARRHGWTTFMALLAGFQSLLARYSAQEDVVVGSPVANRGRLELEGLIGFFTNTLALRLDLSGDPSFREIGRRVRAMALDAYDHQDVPFEELVRELAPERSPGRHPLFQTLLIVQKPAPRPVLAGLETELLDVDTGTAKLDLTLMLDEGGIGSGMTGSLEYARDLFDPATVDRLTGHLEMLLQSAVDDPGRKLSELSLLTEPETIELAAWTRQRTPDPAELLVHEVVMAQAERTPEALAVSTMDGAETLTYAELATRARSLARRLRQAGVGPDVPVGLFLERSPDLMVAVLGVLVAGGVCLPLDPAWPAARLRRMLDDSRAPVVVTHGPLAAVVPEGSAAVVRVDSESGGEVETERGIAVLPGHLAYIIYTSGSTGRPKGVAMTHAALAAMLQWQQPTSAAKAGRTLQLTSLSFDVSFQEILSTWWAGGTLVMVSEDVRRDPPALVRLLAEQRIERLFLPFVALQQLALAALAGVQEEGDAFPSHLREVMSAGEQLFVTPQVVELFSRLPGSELHNHYGPSETHVVTWSRLTGDPSRWPERPPIGAPLGHVRIHLLDANLNPVPLGVAGEIWAAGPGLARDYLRRPRLTAERFLPDPFDWAGGWQPGDRMYRTGDLARRRADGQLEFLGRGDAQVKIRGHRVELFEVETALARHPAVQQAAVAVRGETASSRRLVGYVALGEEGETGEIPGFGDLRAFLAESLPDPMIPTAWARIEAFPLTPTGKLDRRALARIEPQESASQDDFVAPRTPAEELLAAVWIEVLGVPRVGAHHDFFELGGHSLLATQVASRIREAFGVDLPLRRIFEASILSAMTAAVLDAGEMSDAMMGTTAVPPLRPAPRTGDLPLSFAQERLWILDRIQGGGSAYNIPLALLAEGRLDPARLAAAITGLVRRHEVLRTVIAERDEGAERADGPVQAVAAPGLVALPGVDLRGLPADQVEEEGRRIATAEALRPFDLARGPLLRALLVTLAPERSLILISLHHIVTDGWSMGVLVRDVNALYAGRPLPKLAVQYADFAVWQRSWLSGEVLTRQIAWWRERLRGAPAALELPVDRPRPPVQTQRGADHAFTLDAGLTRRILDLARQEGVTPFMVLAAGLLALLSRLSGQQDLTLGSPIANRNRIETEDLIGFFVNSLVLRADLSRAETFRDLLRQVREASLGAYAHQDVPFEKLVDELHAERDLSRSPLFQVILALQNAPLPTADLGDVRLTAEEIPTGVSKFDLAFIFVEDGGRLEGLLQYASDLFDLPTVARYARHLEVLLEELTRRPRGLLGEVSLLAVEERQQLLREWNDTAVDERGRTAMPGGVVGLVRACDPASPAVVHGGAVLTYGDLTDRASRLAAELGFLDPEIPVGLHADRSPEMVLGALAVLWAGGSYMPLDPAYPEDRLAAVARESGMTTLLMRGEAAPSWAGEARVIRLDRPSLADPVEPLAPDADRLAYVIYTSGSTGRPKGVQVPHGGLMNLVRWTVRSFGITSQDRTTLVASPSFDASVFELWPGLTAGAAFYIPDDEIRLSPGRFAAWLAAKGITFAFLPTPLAEQLVEEEMPEGLSLRFLHVGGDRLRRAPRKPLPFQLVNHYGPTENSVVATSARIEPLSQLPPSIGRPIDGVRVHLVDERLVPVPVGVAGELLLGGASLARGYLGRPELTAAQFIPDPFQGEGARLYRTGDRVRYRANGELEFLGRNDQQVKIRGHRIELGEIEGALLRHPGVREAVVMAREDVPGEKRLVAYLVPHVPHVQEAPSAAGLRSFLEETLPEFMVPGAFVEMASLPVTANGKIDRKALPAPRGSGKERSVVPPRNDLERAIAAAWREVLHLDEIGVEESFFEAGGSSLLLAKLQSRLRASLGREIPFVELFRHPTIESLARSLEQAGEPPKTEEKAEQVRARTDTRREALKQLQQKRGQLRGRKGVKDE